MIEKKIKENGVHFCIVVCYFFNAEWNWTRCRSRWENLDQPIKFVNSVVLSPCETQPYNKSLILDIRVYVKWHLSKQVIHWSVSPDCIAGSGLELIEVAVSFFKVDRW